MICVLLSWIALFGATFGVGFIAVRCLTRLSERIDASYLDVFQFFWMGVAVTVAAAHLVHFFFPLNSVCLAVWLAVGAMGLCSFIRERLGTAWLQRLAHGLSARIRTACFTALLLLFAYLGASGVGHGGWSGAYDTELYHFNVIRWLNEYPVVPGLGNLHVRLAHTSGFATYSALVDNLWWDGRTAWVTCGLFTTIAGAQWLYAIMAHAMSGPRRVTLFCVVTFPYLLNLQATLCPTLYCDDVALILQMMLMMELLTGSKGQAGGAACGSRYTWTRMTFLATVAALGFSVKPIGATGLIFVVLLACHVAGVMVFRERPAPRASFSVICAAGSIPGLLLAGHVLRNAIMTGWLFFPAPAGRLDVDWAMPRNPVGPIRRCEIQSVAGQYDVIKAWARLPGPDYHKAMTEGFSYWFPRWKARVWKGLEPRWLYLGSLMVLLHLGRRVLSPNERRGIGYDLFLIAWSVCSVLYWFLTAPDMRFGNAFFWIWLGLGAALLLDGIFRKREAALALAILLSAYSIQSLSISVVPRRHSLMAGIGKATSRPVKQVVIDNGQSPPLRVYVPVSGDQCGDSPLPSTPYPLESLQARIPNSLRSGFRSVMPGP